MAGLAKPISPRAPLRRVIRESEDPSSAFHLTPQLTGLITAKVLYSGGGGPGLATGDSGVP